MGKVDIRCNFCDQHIYEDEIWWDQYSWAVEDKMNAVAQAINDHYRTRHKFKELMTIDE
jgi:hypothetical protein